MKKGFTLMELLVVVVVVALLSSFAIPQYIDYKERTRMVEGFLIGKKIRDSIERYVDATGNDHVPSRKNPTQYVHVMNRKLIFEDLDTDFMKKGCRLVNGSDTNLHTDEYDVLICKHFAYQISSVHGDGGLRVTVGRLRNPYSLGASNNNIAVGATYLDIFYVMTLYPDGTAKCSPGNITYHNKDPKAKELCMSMEHLFTP